MYSSEEKQRALSRLKENELNIKKTVQELGYPCEDLLRKWSRRLHSQKRRRSRSVHVAYTLLKPKIYSTIEVKLEAIQRCYYKGESPSKVAQEMGLSGGSVIHAWHREYLKKGYVTSMKRERKKTPPRDRINPTEQRQKMADDYEVLKAAYEALDAQNRAYEKERRQLIAEREKALLERDVLEKTIEIIKKDPRVNPEALSNRERVVIVDALGDRYSRPVVWAYLKLSRSSYYYAKAAMQAQDKYEKLRKAVIKLFTDNYSAFGYRRIWSELKKLGFQVSEKVVRQLMKDEGLVVLSRSRRKYNSYQGELSAAPANLLERNFHADQANEKWLTDITEFSIPSGKVYLSPIIDCYDGLVVSWSIGTRPTAELANSSLQKAVATLKGGEHPLIHSDRGGHYRWPDWVAITTEHHLTRSMSKKGCSPDNSACEGFFGRLKNECFYNRSFAKMTTDNFIDYLEKYIQWYNNKRIKKSLGYLSPVQYRQHQLQAA